MTSGDGMDGSEFLSILGVDDGPGTGQNSSAPAAAKKGGKGKVKGVAGKKTKVGHTDTTVVKKRARRRKKKMH